MLPRPEYPRPQFRRPQWINLNGPWHFAFDDGDAGLRQGWSELTAAQLLKPGSPLDRSILVPFCPEARLSGIGGTGFHDVVWYARSFTPSLTDGGRLRLHFGAVDYRATVWVNGIQVAQHEGGHTPFGADIESAVRQGTNVVVVRAEDEGRNPGIPRGKQHWQEKSEGIFYTRTTGIWQTVWLEPLSRAYIDNLRMTPQVDEAALQLSLDVKEAPVGATVRCRVAIDGTVAAERVLEASDSIQTRVTLPQPIDLWEPGNPRLYQLTVELLSPPGHGLDEVESYFGMRSIELRDGRVCLNGKPLYQRLVLDQGYFPGGLLTAPTDRDLRRDIELAQAMGFNGARKHQKIEDPRWLTWADRLGFLVWGEMANAHEFTVDSAERTRREWLEALRRDHNHPSIVAWVPVNESWGTPNLAGDPVQVSHLAGLAELTR